MGYDRRDYASSKRWWVRLERLTAYMKDYTQGEDEDGEPILIAVPVRMEVCGSCDGRGAYVNPNIDRHGLSREDFDEDPDFYKDYRAGAYDIQCAHCEGLRVTPVPIDEEMQKRIQKDLDEDEEYYSMVQAEIDFGA